jgi:hypothetical protein
MPVVCHMLNQHITAYNIVPPPNAGNKWKFQEMTVLNIRQGATAKKAEITKIIYVNEDTTLPHRSRREIGKFWRRKRCRQQPATRWSNHEVYEE